MKLLKILIIVLLIGYLPVNIIAQQAIIVAGGDLTTSNVTASYSLGQISYQYFYNGNGYVDQGVQQPAEWSTQGSHSAPAALQAEMAIACAGGDLTGAGTASYSAGQVGYTYYTIATSGYQVDAGIQQPNFGGGSQLMGESVAVAPTLKESSVIYPNPSNGNFTVRLSSSDKKDNAVVTVYDLYGKIVLTGTIPNIGGFMQKTFSSSNLAAGMYFVQYNIGGKRNSIRLSVSH